MSDFAVVLLPMILSITEVLAVPRSIPVSFLSTQEVNENLRRDARKVYNTEPAATLKRNSLALVVVVGPFIDKYTLQPIG